MKRTLAVLLVGLGAPMLQGALHTFVPARFAPDLGLLIAIAVGLHWRSAAAGLAIVAGLGFAADLLSGSLLGEHALLRMLAFGAARVASRQLNLRGVVPQAFFALVFTAVNALGVGLLNTFFTSGGGLDLVMLWHLAPHASINAVFAPPVARAIAAIASAFGEDEGGRRPLRLATRRGPA